MAYIPSGAIKLYMSMKSIITERFSDEARDPYVTLGKYNRDVMVTIRRKGQDTITHSVQIGDVKHLTEVYNQLYQMASAR